MKRFLKVLALFIAACILVALAVANRQPVRFIVDPFINREIAFSIEAPLFLYLFGALLLGLIIGFVTAWVGQGHWRKAARKEHREAVLWKREAENLKRGLESASSGPVPAATPRLSAVPRLRSYL